LVRRSAGEDHPGTWALPGGKLKDGEDPATAACRETFEELGWDPGSAGTLHTRRIAEGVDYTTFLKDVDHEFTPPAMNGEHDGWMWVSPTEALAEHEAKADAVARTPLTDAQQPPPLAADADPDPLAYVRKAARLRGYQRMLAKCDELEARADALSRKEKAKIAAHAALMAAEEKFTSTECDPDETLN
jgi:ADP-ribose pyrophosphatase YjhB (NUDIX family)